MNAPPKSDAWALKVYREDNVATVLTEISRGKFIDVIWDNQLDLRVLAQESIPLAHKIALRDISKGDEIIKYGECIGETSSQISTGLHVHVHNTRSRRGSNEMG